MTDSLDHLFAHNVRWAAEMLSAMHHSVLYSIVAPRAASTTAIPRAIESEGGMAHELYAPMFAGVDWTEFDHQVSRTMADCKAEQHARRLRRQWTRGVSMMRPAAAMETAIFV